MELHDRNAKRFETTLVILKILFIIGFILDILLYPISAVLTDYNKVNAVLDRVNAEQVISQLAVDAISNELQSNLSKTDEASIKEIHDQVSQSIQSESNLKGQRTEAIKTLYTAISQRKVPVISFSFENPLSKIKDKVSDTARTFIDNLKNLSICKTDTFFKISLPGSGNTSPDSNCQTLIGLLTGKSETPQPEDIILKPSYEFTTNLGITEQNIESISSVYRTIKTIPEIILIFNLAMLLLIYLLSYPDKNTAIRILKLNIGIDIFTFVLWLVLPRIIEMTQPITLNVSSINSISPALSNLPSSEALDLIKNLQNLMNNTLSELVYEMSKNVLLVPLLITCISIGVLLLYLLIDRINKKMGVISPESNL